MTLPRRTFRTCRPSRSSSGVLDAERTVCSPAKAVAQRLFGQAGVFRSCLLFGLCLVLFVFGVVDVQEAESAMMPRRQQGILTGMPFMANITPRTFVDDAGRKLYIAKAPSRVVSLAPSITEMLFALGLDEQIVGVTELCDFPAAALSKPKVGYARHNLEALIALRPDMIVAPQEFLRSDVVAKLEELKIPVFLMDAKTVDDILMQIQSLGKIFNKTKVSDEVTGRMRERIAAVAKQIAASNKKRVLYVLNSHPLITVGPGSYIHQMIGLAGGINVAHGAASPYPTLSIETVLQEDPEVIIFPVGPVESVPKSEQNEWNRWSSLSAVRHRQLREVSSDALNRPGPRVVEGLELLARAIHPEVSLSDNAAPLP
ncbi:putative Vitamin B12 import system, periplasmic binding protein BtuF [Nitrospira japonica]|uniref:Putative Vitamin B12 import system, periplasmic binding protein BtuF n=1 Tax=Nitrospira japonica TaxID=1325564 RepID=A0A1W1IAD0_9BACT|nr:putative Vitamin B12 import system, periplasmic binding protein BtuF [Nitrospira japonica]